MEEIKNEETPSTSRITEVTTTSNNTEIEKQNARKEEAFNFQMMVQDMRKAEGVKIHIEEYTTHEGSKDRNTETQNVTTDQQNREEHSADEETINKEGVKVEKNYFEKQREILVSQAMERVKELDMSATSLTFEEYMSSFDKSAEQENKTVKSIEESDKETSHSTCNMTKNIGQRNLTEENDCGSSHVNKLTKNMTLKDIMEENNVINGGSDSDDSDSSEDERNASDVSGKGDGHPICRLRKPEEIKEIIESALTKLQPKQTEENEPNTYENKEDNTEDSTKHEMNYEKTDTMEVNNSKAEELNNYISNEPQSKDVVTDEFAGKNATCANEIIRINETTIKKRNSDSEESDDSSGDEEKPYYKKLDQSDSTKLKQIDDTISTVNVKSKEEIKEVLTGGHQVKEKDDQDASYREILKWNLRVPEQNVQILSPIQRKKPEKDFKDELCEMLAQSKREDKPEFQVTPPEDIAEENDKILYPKNTRESICCVKYKSMFTESGKTAEVKPPLVHKVLKLSQNYPVFQKNQNEVIKNEVKEDLNVPENSLIVCNKISEVRDQMAEFTKKLEEFNERSRLAREEVIKDYNSAVERELKIVEKLMKMRENMFDKKYTKPTIDAMKNRKVDYIDENVMRKHFEDMDMILEEDSTDSEEELRATVEKINKTIFKDLGANRMQQMSNRHEEYVSGENSTDIYEEEEKKDKEKRGIDSESYLTKNDEDQEYEDRVKNKSTDETSGEDEDEDNVKEKNDESCEEYFTTNEDEEYYDTSNIKEDISTEKPLNYQQFISNLMEQNKNEVNEEDDNCKENNKESATSRYDEKETDDNAIVDMDENPVIKRTVNCSLEMQLAKKVGN